MFPRPTSLRFALLLTVLVALVPILALTLFHAAGIRRQLQEERQAEASRLAEQVAASVSRYLEGTRQLLVALSHTPALRAPQSSAAVGLLEELRSTSPLFANLSLVRGDGTIAVSALPAPAGLILSDRSWFRRLQANRHLGLGEYQIGRVTDKASITIACPLSGQTTAGPLDCVIAALDLQVLLQLLDEFPVPPEVDLVLLDRNGTVLSRRGVPLATSGRPFPGWSAPPNSRALSALDEEGRPRIFNFTLVPSVDEGLWVGVGRLKTTVHDEARGAFLRSFAASVLCVTVALFLSWRLGEHLVLRPIRRLSAAALALTRGRWEARAGIASGAAELRELGTAFDAMAGHLHRELEQLKLDTASADHRQRHQSTELASTQQRLQQAIQAQQTADTARRQSEATAHAFIDSIPETALLLDPEGLVLLANPTSAGRLGFTLAGLVGSDIFSHMPEDLAAQRRAHLATVVRTGRPLAFDEQRSNRSLHTQLTPVLDASGQVSAIAALSFDITERQHMEEQLRRSIAELERALSEVKTLSGLLPICAGCKKIRDDKGYWNHVEQYLRQHTQAEFSHGLCPDCIRRLYPEYADEICPSDPGPSAPANPPAPTAPESQPGQPPV
ncbi:MAG: PAS domain-containing protein [Opitutaceae bacterium]|nr:PAS domain-containing protein [Opitutaceae bacterium]